MCQSGVALKPLALGYQCQVITCILCSCISPFKQACWPLGVYFLNSVLLPCPPCAWKWLYQGHGKLTHETFEVSWCLESLSETSDQSWHIGLQGMLPHGDREECWVSTVGNIVKVLSIMLTPCSCFFDHWQLYVLHFEGFTLSGLKQFTIFPMFSGCRISATSLPTRAPLWYTCLFNSSFLVCHPSSFGKALSNYLSWQLWQSVVPWLLLTGLDVVLPGVVVQLCLF